MEKTYRILKVIILILALVVLILGATRLYNTLSAQMEPEMLVNQPSGEGETQPERKAAPDFTVVDQQGNSYKLSDFAGQPVVLNFWASWCGPCKMEMPDFEEKYREYGDQVAFLMVNLTDGSQETVETAASFVEEMGYTFPVYYDTGREAAFGYSVTAVPMTYFIDAQGAIAKYQKGMVSADVLQSGIDMILE